MLVSMVAASLYVVALCLAMTLILPVPRNASRVARVASVACGTCGAAANAAALVATVSGLWALAGGLVVVAAACTAIWLRLALSSGDTEPDDGDDNDDGGSGRPLAPVPPSPCAPVGGPPLDWERFDRARAAWEDARLPAGV
jgi:hypothetical protein